MLKSETLCEPIQAQNKTSSAGEQFVIDFLEGKSFDLDPVLRLRYEIFNLELREGFSSSHITGRDEDEFDGVCDHLVVYKQSTGKPVGTYRMQTLEMAERGLGFYSATEFELGNLPASFFENAVEIGRACIAKEYRNIKVLYLLWKGLFTYLAKHRKKCLFGCTSLTSQDLLEGNRVFAYLKKNWLMHPVLFARPKPDFDCSFAESLVSSEAGEADIPRLFKAYLSFGAKVCSAPAIDRTFGTIDFLTFLNVDEMDDKARRFFYGKTV
jgi:putative hemolysin